MHGNVAFFCSLLFGNASNRRYSFITTKANAVQVYVYTESIQIVGGYFLMQKRRFEMLFVFCFLHKLFQQSFTSFRHHFACVCDSYLLCRLSAIVNADVSFCFRMYFFILVNVCTVCCFFFIQPDACTVTQSMENAHLFIQMFHEQTRASVGRSLTICNCLNHFSLLQMFKSNHLLDLFI